jgi:ferritin-like protein
MGAVGVSRRTLLARAGIGTGAGVFALLGATATPAFADASISDLANVRIVCVAKRVAINWLTSWVNTPKAVDSSSTNDLIRAIRSQEQGHYGLLAPLLNGTAPVDDDYTYSFPAGALKSFDRAANFALDLEEMLLGIAIGAAATSDDPAIAELQARVVAGDGQHFSALSVLAGGPPTPDGAPRALSIQDGGNQLSQFLSN